MDDSRGGGWYKSRRQYRSVAFGTWAPGAANQIFNKENQKKREENEDSSKCEDRLPLGGCARTTNRTHGIGVIAAWNAEHYGSEGQKKRMGESTPELHRLQLNEKFLLPSRGLDASRSTDNVHRILRERDRGRRGDLDNNKDCFSSTEYVAYLDRKASEEYIRVPSNDLFPSSCGSASRFRTLDPSRTVDETLKYRLETSVHRAHRSHSAGASSVYRVDKCEMGHSDRTVPSRDPRFLRATKRFFRKIYTTATLPKKVPPTSNSMDSFRIKPMFDNRYPHSIRFAEDIDDSLNSYSTCSSSSQSRGGSHRINNNKSIINQQFPENNFNTLSSENAYADSGVDDRSVTPDQSVDDSTSKSDCNSSDSANGSAQENLTDTQPWNGLFEQLKREILLMRERDQQILSDLHKVESQLRSVRVRAQTTDTEYYA